MNIYCNRCGKSMGFTTFDLPDETDFYCFECKSKLLEGMSVNKI